VSWGSTLALAYALAHPSWVSEVVVTAVTSTSREEVDWITEGVGRIFPEAWAQLASFAAIGERVIGPARGVGQDAGPAAPGERIIKAYARLLRDPDPATRAAAAQAWDRWESTHVSLDPNWKPGLYRADPRDRENFATLVTHYWAHDGFLGGERRILDRIHELAGVPGVLIHGRHDISGPAITAWTLHQRWPGSRLHIVETEGHGGPEMMELTATEIDAAAGSSRA
jgi:proline iminopeptidase